jgi:hypothetical protein
MQKAGAYFKRFDHFRGTWIVAYAADGVRGEGKKWEVLKDGLKAKVVVFASPPSALPSDADKLSKVELQRFQEMQKAKHRRKEFITVPGEKNLQVHSPTKLMDELNPTEQTANRIIGNTPFAPCYGYLEFEPIMDSLQSMDLSAEVSDLDGSEVHVLHGKARDGSRDIQLWFDPKLEYVIRKIECQKRVSAPGVPDGSATLVYTQRDFREVRGVLIPFAAEGIATTPPKPRPFIENGKRVIRQDASGNVIMKPANTVTVYQELQRFEYEPACVPVDFDPTIAVEEGARVQMRDAKQLRYEWKEGKPEPVVPDIPTGHEFAQEGKPTGRLLMVFGAVVLTILVVVMLYRRRKQT